MLSALAPMGLVVNLGNTLGLLTLAALLLFGFRLLYRAAWYFVALAAGH